jgi:hypothetical protein
MTDDERDFHLDEHEHFKKEISSLTDRQSGTLQYVLGGTAAIYLWALTNHIYLAAFIPVLLSVFGAAICFLIECRMKSMRRYLKKLEEVLADPDLGGWERFREADRTRGVARKAVQGLWIIIILKTLTIPLLFPGSFTK